jgi:hypothetical protein
MKRQKIKEWFGFKLIANHNTREIHRAEHITDRCRLFMMRNASYISTSKANKLLAKDYNGCRYCYKEKDKG